MEKDEREVDVSALVREVPARHPPFWAAVVADARVTALHRGERGEFRSRADAIAQALRLAWQSDAFLAQAIYRAKARMQALGIPLLPRLAHRLAIAIGQVAIGDLVVIQPGVYVMHGQVVIDGITEIGSGVLIAPFTSIGLVAGGFIGPVIEDGAMVGTGARVLGRLRVGAGASIGANAVVLNDVPAWTTVVGAPAHPVSDRVA